MKKNNNRISQAEFKGRVLSCLDAIRKDIDEIKNNNHGIHEEITANTREISNNCAEIKVINTRLGIFAAAQAGLTLVASSIAAFLGMRR